MIYVEILRYLYLNNPDILWLTSSQQMAQPELEPATWLAGKHDSCRAKLSARPHERTGMRAHGSKRTLAIVGQSG